MITIITRQHIDFTMKWEYAALEQILGGLGWVLRKTRTHPRPQLKSPNQGADSPLYGGCEILYRVDHNHDSLDLVNMAAADGWEMTGQLPISFNEHHGRYHTCSMMRRRIE